MIVNITEFRKHLGKYLDKSRNEDIYVTKRGSTICILSSSHVDKLQLVDSLVGVLPMNSSLEEAKDERLARQ